MARPRKTTTQLNQYSQAVKDLRGAYGMSQQQFSNSIGLSINSIARYETGRTPDAASLVLLAKMALEIGYLGAMRFFLGGAASEIGAKEVRI